MNTNAVYVFLPFTTEKRASFRKLAEETAKSPCWDAMALDHKYMLKFVSDKIIGGCLPLKKSR